MGLFTKDNSGELDLILDVQTAVVRGSLVIYDGANLPNVIFTYNAVIAWKAHTDNSYLIKSTLKAVAETVEAARRFTHLKASKDKIPRKIKEVHFALSSPWIVSTAKTVKASFEKDTEITKGYVLKMIEDERKVMTAASTEDLTVIEQKIFDVRLNGYSVGDWLGKQARDFEISYTISIAGSRMIERFKDICIRSIHRCDIFYHSSLLLQQIGVRAIYPNQPNYGLIHVHGELTEVAIISNNVSTFFGYYPLGVRSLVRKIANSTKTDQQTADSALALYVGGHMDEEHAAEEINAIKNVATGWAMELKRLIEKKDGSFSLPENVYLSSWSHDDFFAAAIRFVFPKMRVNMISIDDIAPLVSFDDKAEHRRLTGLYALAIHTVSKQ